jgi:hypothetical protein
MGNAWTVILCHQELTKEQSSIIRTLEKPIKQKIMKKPYNYNKESKIISNMKNIKHALQ